MEGKYCVWKSSLVWKRKLEFDTEPREIKVCLFFTMRSTSQWDKLLKKQNILHFWHLQIKKPCRYTVNIGIKSWNLVSCDRCQNSWQKNLKYNDARTFIHPFFNALKTPCNSSCCKITHSNWNGYSSRMRHDFYCQSPKYQFSLWTQYLYTETNSDVGNRNTYKHPYSLFSYPFFRLIET